MHQKCTGCGVTAPAFRCRDCVMGPLFCQSCLLVHHTLCLLHIAEVHIFHLLWFIYCVNYADSVSQCWNGTFFEKIMLKNLGLCIQLGNHINHNCPTQEPGHKEFIIIVIDTNGIHEVAIDFCQCNATKHNIQLLRLGWWPATPLNPKMCATMNCLNSFNFSIFKASWCHTVTTNHSIPFWTTQN